ncbi:ATP-binding protein [Natronomonas salina]|uniref:ATP-binding protein n=1 Tax=Natronomonas salina TaxID=1710540 RepID=UPI0015B48FB2|nr:ATP-binding protein [Natronomonas salina]QLD89103.1 ATP-binding protein [Natronomonas salina]
MVTQDPEKIEQTSDLAQLSSFLAKQHDQYLEMLQEPIDNSVSATVKSEQYFRDPEPVNIQIDLERRPNTVRAIVADEGPGMDRDTIREIIFQTANEKASDGILNNMGAGLKASIAWCENSLRMAPGANFSTNGFHLLSRTGSDAPIQRVDGPISNEMSVYNSEDEELWAEGASELSIDSSGTRVHLTAARSDFDVDVARRSSSMQMKASYVALVLGIRFRRLLGAQADNSITITYRDIDGDEEVSSEDTIKVPPVDVAFIDAAESAPSDMADYDSFEEFEAAVADLEISEDAKYGYDTTTITDELGVTYNVSYEYGNIDLKAMGEAVDADERNFKVTTDGSDNFRYRYRISTNDAGVDVYANGRVLDTNEWPFDISRHQTLNRFNGVIRIEPASEEHEVPTNNEKTGIDKTSSLWEKLRKWLNDDSRRPQRTQYESGSDDDDDDPGSGDGGDTGDTNGGDDDTGTGDGGDDTGGEGNITGGDGNETDDDDDTGDDNGDDTTDSDDESGGDDDDGWDDDDETDDDEDEDESDQTDIEGLVDNLEASAKAGGSLQAETEIDGGEIDLIHNQADGPTNLYKIVHGQARPEDIYEMMMYQDHFKRSGDGDYGQTILLCTGLTDDAQSDYDSITRRTDDHDGLYEFVVVTPGTESEDRPWVTE